MFCFLTRSIFFSWFLLFFMFSGFVTAASVEEIFGEVRGFSIAKGIASDSLSLPEAHLSAGDLLLDKGIKKQIRKFVDEKIRDYPSHNFFSVDRFSDVPVPETTDQELIRKWEIWYFCKCLVKDLGGIKAEKELDIALKSKVDFYENIAFITTAPEIGEAAREFYKKELEAVDKLPEYQID